MWEWEKNYLCIHMMYTKGKTNMRGEYCSSNTPALGITRYLSKAPTKLINPKGKFNNFNNYFNFTFQF